MARENRTIDFDAIEADVDEDGNVAPPDDLGGGVGVETRYARLYSMRSTEKFVEFYGDYEDCYISIRVPLETLREFLAGEVTS